MTARKDYNYLCGLDHSEHSSAGGHPPGASVANGGNSPIFGGVGAMNIVMAALYFCNQRPGIFVAPYLLLQGVPESNIGFVMFVSGIVALILQTPAGQLVDEVHNKTRVLVAGYLATIAGCVLLSNVSHIVVVTLAVTINVVSDVFVFPSLYATTLGIFGSEDIEKQAPLNETGMHSGNAFFASLAGAVVVLGVAAPSSIFYICVGMRCVGIYIILRHINSYDIDFKRSRGLVEVSATSTSASAEEELGDSAHSHASLSSIFLPAPEEPLSYQALLTDGHVLVFLLSVALFHFANAAMLPLLSQQLFINNSEKGE